MTPADHVHQAEAFFDYYSRSPTSLPEAFRFWCHSKDLEPADRRAIAEILRKLQGTGPR